MTGRRLYVIACNVSRLVKVGVSVNAANRIYFTERFEDVPDGVDVKHLTVAHECPGGWDPYGAEKVAHRLLENMGHSVGREWFDCSVETAVAAVQAAVSAVEDQRLEFCAHFERPKGRA